MKKRLFIIALTSILILTSCVSLPESDTKIANRLGKQLIEYINSHDESGIKSMFCKKSQESETIDEEITGLFEVISDTIVSYEKITCNSGESVDDGELTRQQLTIFIDGIKTKDGNTFSIVFYTLNVYEENADIVGVSEIDIYQGQYGNKNTIHYIIGNLIKN